MFAVVRTGGKQYRVAADQQITVERLDGEIGASLTLDTLISGEGGELSTDRAVTAEIVGHSRGDKVIIFKKKRRHNYRRKNGHRQEQTVLKIVSLG